MNKLNILGAKMGLYGLRYDECRSSIVPASTKSTLIIEASFTAGSSDRSFQFSSKVPRKYSSILSADKYILFIDDLNGCFRREIPYYKAIREQGRCCYLRIPAFCEPCRALRQAIAVSQIAIHTFNEGYLHMLGLHVSLKRSEVSVLDDYYGTTSGKKRCIPYTFAWLEITLLKTSPIQSVSFDGTKTNSAETTLMPSTEVKQMRCGNDDAFTKKMKRSGSEEDRNQERDRNQRSRVEVGSPIYHYSQLLHSERNYYACMFSMDWKIIMPCVYAFALLCCSKYQRVV
eukprot:CFRG3206T1